MAAGRNFRARRRAMAGAAAMAAALLAGAIAGAAAEELVQRAVRNVTPPGMTPGPAVTGPLIREEEPEPPPDAARWHRFSLPETTDAATFKVKDQLIRISGVEPPKRADLCKAGNESWPCGATALHSFRIFIGGRDVECYYPAPQGQADIVAPCRVGKTDLGLWLLTAGWGSAGHYATEAYRKAADAARCARRGIWRDTAADGTCPVR
jgi:endonuclease YncB( thermonuclease family)